MRSNAKRLDELMEELDEIKTLSSHLEDFVFLEEAATKLVTEIRKLSQKYPRDQNLEEAARETARGFEQFHHGVITCCRERSRHLTRPKKLGRTRPRNSRADRRDAAGACFMYHEGGEVLPCPRKRQRNLSVHHARWPQSECTARRNGRRVFHAREYLTTC